VNPALRASAAHVFVESLQAPHLVDDDDHHLRRVLRVRVDEQITVSDGAGAWAPAVLTRAGVQLVGDVVVESVGQPITIATAIPKGDRLEWMVQKLTELGVDRIVLVEFERSVVRLRGDREAKQLARLQRIVREAAMQSRRVRLPQLELAEFADVVGWPATALAEPGGEALGARTQGGFATVVIGPEGGFSPAELGCQLPRVSLATTILRVETAAIVAAVQLSAR
jgi:16S rRNA (uracil1498-N3)-methyltransferase